MRRSRREKKCRCKGELRNEICIYLSGSCTNLRLFRSYSWLIANKILNRFFLCDFFIILSNFVHFVVFLKRIRCFRTCRTFFFLCEWTCNEFNWLKMCDLNHRSLNWINFKSNFKSNSESLEFHGWNKHLYID